MWVCQIALQFVERANTDGDGMTLEAEALLMGSAYDQLFGSPSKPYELGKRFGALLRPFGSVQVAKAKTVRPGIDIDTSDPARAAAQPQWWVHQKWMEELFDVRSKATHKGHHDDRPWRWRLHEHLLMAAFAFPLTVKLLLAKEDLYALSDDDEGRLASIDRLLSVSDWDAVDSEPAVHRWWSIWTDLKLERVWKRANEGALADIRAAHRGTKETP